MRKTIGWLTCLLVLTAVILGTACKARDAKKLAMALAPKLAANPCGSASYLGNIGPENFCEAMDGNTAGYADVFDDCGYARTSGRTTAAASKAVDMVSQGSENVYSFTLTEGMWISVDVFNASGFPCLSVRTNCDPNDHEAVLNTYMGEGYAYFSGYLEPGTYYVVIDSPFGDMNYQWGICDEEAN
jgi:hypothetical protein